MNRKWWYIGCIFAGVAGTTIGTGIALYKARTQMEHIEQSMGALDTAMSDMVTSLDGATFEMEMQLEDTFRDMKLFNCNLEPDFELRVACALKIEWPKEL